MIFIVDDDPSMRRALHRIITSAGWQVQIYASGGDFLDAYELSQPGCVVLDLRMPHLSGLTLQELLVAREVFIPVIFITAFGEVSAAVQAMKAGAVDFLEKPFSNQHLLMCIEQAIARDAQLRRAREQHADLNARLARLTPREREVLDLVVSGYMNKEIGVQLDIQLRTVEVHRQNGMRKIGVRSVADLSRLLLIVDGDFSYPRC
jgi:two-component system response regulator TtrR